MWVALTGLVAILCTQYFFLPDFSFVEHVVGSATKEGEWRILLNLIGLLFGFGILAKHFLTTIEPQLISITEQASLAF